MKRRVSGRNASKRDSASTNDDFGVRIKAIRKERKWTQENLKKKVNRSRRLPRSIGVGSIRELEDGSRLDDVARAVIAELARHPAEEQALHRSYDAFKDAPSRAKYGFGRWLTQTMVPTGTIDDLRDSLGKSGIKISGAGVTKWRKGYDPVAPDKISALFKYFEEKEQQGRIPRGSVLEGKRVMLRDILESPSFRALLGERFEAVTSQWIDLAFGPKAAPTRQPTQKSGQRRSSVLNSK